MFTDACMALCHPSPAINKRRR